MAKSDAPNYGPSLVEGELCSNCRFNDEGFCTLWDFVFDQGFRCDSWRPLPDAAPTGIIVAFQPDETSARELAQEGGIPPEDLHLTLAHLGSTDEIESTQQQVMSVLDSFSEGRLTISGLVNGQGRFENDNETAIWATFDSPELPQFRQDLVEALEQADIPVSADHGFTPHITLAYEKEDEEKKVETIHMELAFNELVLMWGAERLSFALSAGSLVDRLFRYWRVRGHDELRDLCCP